MSVLLLEIVREAQLHVGPAIGILEKPSCTWKRSKAQLGVGLAIGNFELA